MSPALNSSGTNAPRQDIDAGESPSEDTREHSAPSRLVDLMALLILASVPLMLVLVGHADTGTVLAVGEFLVASLGVWRYERLPLRGTRSSTRRRR